MPRTYVALDLETTGLNPDKDAIIEVGAVKFRDGEIVEEFTTLVNPGRPIPPEITMITGITDRDVVTAPPFERIEAPLLRFVGQAPVVGHNVSFDLGFMRAHGLLNTNIGLDTWELATILLPSQPGYSLGALAERFGLALPNAHRAADDAHATGWLFELLCAEAGRLPRAVLMEIARVAYGSDWPLAEVFGAALMAAGVGRVPRDELPLDQLAPDSVLFGPWRAAEPLAPREHPEAVDATELAAMLKPGGAFSAAFPGYEFRPPQVDMLEAVASAFNQGHHLMVEAGTGTGKSVAYLLPAIAYAAKNNTRVVISTNTINLQDQLFRKDLPDLEHVLGKADPAPDLTGLRKPARSSEPFRPGWASLAKSKSDSKMPTRSRMVWASTAPLSTASHSEFSMRPSRTSMRTSGSTSMRSACHAPSASSASKRRHAVGAYFTATSSPAASRSSSKRSRARIARGLMPAARSRSTSAYAPGASRPSRRSSTVSVSRGCTWIVSRVRAGGTGSAACSDATAGSGDEGASGVGLLSLMNQAARAIETRTADRTSGRRRIARR